MSAVQQMIAEEAARNESLKAALASLKGGPAAGAPAGVPESAAKAAVAMRIIALSEKELEMKQKIEQQELAVKQINQTLKEDNQALKKLQGEIDKERSSGKSVWETVGISTIQYKDPFHTGLSKRTPTGGHFTS